MLSFEDIWSQMHKNQLQIATIIPDFHISSNKLFIDIKPFLCWSSLKCCPTEVSGSDISIPPSSRIFFLSMDVTDFQSWRETKKITKIAFQVCSNRIRLPQCPPKRNWAGKSSISFVSILMEYFQKTYAMSIVAWSLPTI